MATGGRFLLPEQSAELAGRPTLVLDLDNTLIDGEVSRPGLCNFLRAMKDLYEIVIFTAGGQVYAEPIIDKISRENGMCIAHRLYRDSCIELIVKPLQKLGRPMARTIVLDDNPATYVLNPSNAVGIKSFFREDAATDTELLKLTPLLTAIASAPDLRVARMAQQEGARRLPRMRLDSLDLAVSAFVTDRRAWWMRRGNIQDTRVNTEAEQ